MREGIRVDLPPWSFHLPNVRPLPLQHLSFPSTTCRNLSDHMGGDDCDSVSSMSTTDGCSMTTSWAASNRDSIATTRPSTSCTFDDNVNADWLAAQIDECLAAMNRPCSTAERQQSRSSFSTKAARAPPPALDLSAARMSKCIIETPLPSSPDLLGLAMSPSKSSSGRMISRRSGVRRIASSGSPSPVWGNAPLLFCPLMQQGLVGGQCDAAPFPYSPCRDSIQMVATDLDSSSSSRSRRSMFGQTDILTTPDGEFVSFTLTDCQSEHADELHRTDTENGTAESRMSALRDRASPVTSHCDASSHSLKIHQEDTETLSKGKEATMCDVLADNCLVIQPADALLGTTRPRKVSILDVPRREASLAGSTVSNQSPPTHTHKVEETRKLNKLKQLLGDEVEKLTLDASPPRTSVRGWDRSVGGSHSAEARHQKPLPKVPVTKRAGRSQTTDGIDPSLVSYLSLNQAKGSRKPFFGSPKGKSRVQSPSKGCPRCDQSSTTPLPAKRCSHSTDNLRQYTHSISRRSGGVSL